MMKRKKQKKQYERVTVLQQVEVLLEISVMSAATPLDAFNAGGVDVNYQDIESQTVTSSGGTFDWD